GEFVQVPDQRGAVGGVEVLRRHSRTPLGLGLVGAERIGMSYDVWLCHVEGLVIETPRGAADSSLKDKLFHGAYPTHEAHGLVFAYLGPPDEKPPFPIHDSLIRPGYRVMPGRKWTYPGDWLQIMENTMDTAHTPFLHTIVSRAV